MNEEKRMMLMWLIALLNGILGTNKRNKQLRKAVKMCMKER